MSGSHPVRIARSRAPTTSSGTVSRTPASYRPNTDGGRRAFRLFAVFGLGLTVCYGLFLGLASRASGGLAADPGALGLFSVVAIALGLWGAWLTVGRTPRGVWLGNESITVDERWRRPRRFRRAGEAPWTVVQRHPGSPFLGGPTEIVRLKETGGRSADYLLEAGLLDAAPSAA